MPDNKLPRHIRAYGDRIDGSVQMSFSLPMPASEHAKEVAKHYAEAHGLDHVLVASMERASDDFSFFVVYGKSKHTVSPGEIKVPDVHIPTWSPKEIDEHIKTKLKRRIVIVGACTGFDAHTVGIDAIINIKGAAGDKGLESYAWIAAYNLGAQVDNPSLLAKARDLKADAVLVSQIITQRDIHKENAQELILLAQKQNLRHMKFILGGPRIDNLLAQQLGYDAGFGSGTKPSDVAAYILDVLLKEQGNHQ